MNDDFNIEEQASTNARKVNMSKLNNGTTIVLIVGVIIAAIASMSELGITINAETLFEFSLLCIILFIIATIIYLCRYSVGTSRAKSTKEYEQIVTEYEDLKRQIHDKGYTKDLPELCIRYREQELKNYRSAILSDACISYDTYAKLYRDKSDEELSKYSLSPSSLRCIRKADRAKGLRICPEDLMSDKKSTFIRFSALSLNPRTKQNIDITTNTISRFITTAVASSIAVTAMIVMDWQAIAQWAIRMIPIFWAYVKGDNDGEKNIKNTAMPYMARQIQILRLMIQWKDAEASTILKESEK